MNKNTSYEQFDTWCNQWEEAMKKGTFETPNQGPNVSVQTADSNFFGMVNHNPSDSPKEPDTKYWSDVYSLSKEYGSDSQMLDDYLSGDLIQEEVAVDKKAFVKTMASSPNPIRPASVGMDQDVNSPLSVGATYDVPDLQNLETLKTKLHDLLVKLNSMEGKSQSGSPKLESQIQSLQKQIDELSDNLSRGIPSQLGD